MEFLFKRIYEALFKRDNRRVESTFADLFHTFQTILQLNNKILELIADMGTKLGGDYVFDRQYVYSSCRHMGTLVYSLIYNFNAPGSGKIPGTGPRLSRHQP